MNASVLVPVVKKGSVAGNMVDCDRFPETSTLPAINAVPTSSFKFKSAGLGELMQGPLGTASSRLVQFTPPTATLIMSAP